MLTDMTDVRTADAAKRLGVETTGIEIIDESARTAAPRDLFWPWFAANVSVFGISYAAFVLGFGISFWQAVVVTIVGVVVSFALCGIIALAGKRGSAPTMVLSRAAFGVRGQKVPGVISWLTSIGWETFLAILAVLATATIFDRLGWGGGTATKVVAAVVVAAMIVLAAVAGYHVIMRMQSILTWLTGAITVLYVLMTANHVDWSAVTSRPSGGIGAVIGALVLVMTGFGLGWINIAADWSRYQRRDASGAAIVGWNTFGGALAPALLVCYGLALAGSDEDVLAGIGADPIGTLATLLPTWVLVPFLVAAILSLVSGAVLGIYSSGLTLLSLGVRIPRPMAALIDGVILTLGTFYVVFVAESLHQPVPVLPHHARRPARLVGGDHDRRHRAAQARLRRRRPLRLLRPLRRLRLGLDRHDGRGLGARLGPRRQQLRRRRDLEQLAGLPPRPARPRHLRRGPRRLVLGGHLRLRQPRRPARPRPVVRRHLGRPTREGRPPGAVRVSTAVEEVSPLDDEWLVVIDPQTVFADPGTSPWGSPMWAETVPRIARLATAYEGRVVVTRFVADPGIGGSWADYYDDWQFALVPGTDPLYAVVPEARGPHRPRGHRADLRQVDAGAPRGHR